MPAWHLPPSIPRDDVREMAHLVVPECFPERESCLVGLYGYRWLLSAELRYADGSYTSLVYQPPIEAVVVDSGEWFLDSAYFPGVEGLEGVTSVLLRVRY